MTDDIVLEMNDDLSLRRVVFETLRKAILSGRIGPGERLPELPLARKLGVSRTPVREAVRMLKEEGLVRIEPNCGAVVTGITREEMEDLLEACCALECLAAERACSRAGEKERAAMEEAALAFEHSCLNGSPENMISADRQFHLAVIDAAGNHILLRVIESLREQCSRCFTEYLKNPSVYPEAVRGHRRIMEAVKRGDAKSARMAAEEHIQAQKAKCFQDTN